MTPKELKSLAKACRAAGIKVYKDKDVEITIADSEPPKSNYKKRIAKNTKSEPIEEADSIESDGWETLSFEQKLLWSSDSVIDESTNENDS